VRPAAPIRREWSQFRWLRVAAIVVAVVGLVLVYVVQPMGATVVRIPDRRADSTRLRAHVVALAGSNVPRNAAHAENLDRASEYVRDQFRAGGIAAEFQTFLVEHRPFRNVVAHVGPEGGARVVVGAHYDAASAGIGADDDASGVAGLLELARLLHDDDLRLRVDLVAFTLEEPPYFRTHSMGSFVHAQELKKSGVEVRAMIGLEMIGFFRDEEGSQDYPLRGMNWIYPSRGDFIAVVGSLSQSSLVRRVKRAMAESSPLPVWSMNAPRLLPGIDFSDHVNYWDAGFDAVMVTDTAFYRNRNYHEATDTPETLDHARMAFVVDGVRAAVRLLAR
jgi:hypothetical protein